MVDLSKLDKWQLGKCFDHSVLPKNTTEEDIRKDAVRRWPIIVQPFTPHRPIGHR